MRLQYLLALACALGIGERALCQTLVTPSTHWGGVVVPDLENRTDFGLHFVGFTQYGKEYDSTAKRYYFTPYNDIGQTLGFNMLTLSQTRDVHFGKDGGAAPAIGASPLMRRTTYMFGVVDDNVPRWLQNTVIHHARWRGDAVLRGVPRSTTDTPDHISLGEHKLWPPLASVSEEYYLRQFSIRHAPGGDERLPTPFFIGGGWTAGTVDQELFAHAGATVTQTTLPGCAQLAGVKLRTVGLGGMVRAGALFPGHYMPDLTASYANIQAVASAEIDWWEFPTQFELAATSATGFFARSRGADAAEELRQIPGSAPADLYDTKYAMSERFISLRVRIGDFTFETFNDSFGGKDKGPTFGASLMMNWYRPKKDSRSGK